MKLTPSDVTDLLSLTPRPDGAYDLFLIAPLRGVVASAVDLVETAGDPTHPAFARIFGPVDPSVDLDDPLLLFERQSAAEDMVSVVRGSINNDVLSPEEIFTWIRVLALSTAALDALYSPGPANERSPGPLTSLLTSHSLIQHIFVLALDPAMAELDLELSENDEGPVQAP